MSGWVLMKLYRMKDGQFSNASRSCHRQLLEPFDLAEAVPEPNNRAVADSFLNSFAADPALATFATTAGAMIAALLELTIGFGGSV